MAAPFLIRSYLLMPYIDALESKGLSANRLLSAYGLKRAELDEPYNRILFYSFLCVAQSVADMLEDPCLGLRVGAEIRPEQVGSLGLLMAASATLQQALTEFSQWAASMNEGWSLELFPGKQQSEYVYRVLINSAPTRHDVEYSFANMCSLIRSRMGAAWAPDEVHFVHSKASNLQLYEKIFRCPVFFEQQHNALVLSNADLSKRADKINYAVKPIIEAHLRLLAEGASATTTLSAKASAIVARALGEKTISREAVAHELGLSVRSMQRRLAAEGTSLREIVASEREDLTHRLLTQANSCSIIDIAIRTGYSDPSALSRAYRRWTGVTPRSRKKSFGIPERR